MNYTDTAGRLPRGRGLLRVIGPTLGFLYVAGIVELWVALVQRDWASRDQPVSNLVVVAYWSVYVTYAAAAALIIVQGMRLISRDRGVPLALVFAAVVLPCLVVLLWGIYFSAWGTPTLYVPELLPIYLGFCVLNLVAVAYALRSTQR